MARVSRCIESVGRSVVRAGEVMQLLGRRLETGGRRSAWVYARWFLTNGYVRVRNRLARRPRVECPCCGWTGHDFLVLDCGTFTVPHVECPHCEGHERHRILTLYITREHRDFLTMSGRVLHFAPERHVRGLIQRNRELRCVSTDYAMYMVQRFPGPAFQSDMQCLGVANDAFDLLFCLHVLEHVPDDRKGLAELYRILKPGGTAYVMVPFMMGWEKTREFGAPDPDVFEHVRGYSIHDFKERLSPFQFEEIKADSFLTADEVRRYRIPDSQVIYRCTK